MRSTTVSAVDISSGACLQGLPPIPGMHQVGANSNLVPARSAVTDASTALSIVPSGRRSSHSTSGNLGSSAVWRMQLTPRVTAEASSHSLAYREKSRTAAGAVENAERLAR